jgi:hypothetical protein
MEKAKEILAENLLSKFQHKLLKSNTIQKCLFAADVN